MIPIITGPRNGKQAILGGKGLFSPEPPFISSLFRQKKQIASRSPERPGEGAATRPFGNNAHIASRGASPCYSCESPAPAEYSIPPLPTARDAGRARYR